MRRSVLWGWSEALPDVRMSEEAGDGVRGHRRGNRRVPREELLPRRVRRARHQDRRDYQDPRDDEGVLQDEGREEALPSRASRENRELDPLRRPQHDGAAALRRMDGLPGPGRGGRGRDAAQGQVARRQHLPPSRGHACDGGEALRHQGHALQTRRRGDGQRQARLRDASSRYIRKGEPGVRGRGDQRHHRQEPLQRGQKAQERYAGEVLPLLRAGAPHAGAGRCAARRLPVHRVLPRPARRAQAGRDMRAAVEERGLRQGRHPRREQLQLRHSLA